MARKRRRQQTHTYGYDRDIASNATLAGSAPPSGPPSISQEFEGLGLLSDATSCAAISVAGNDEQNTFPVLSGPFLRDPSQFSASAHEPPVTTSQASYPTATPGSNNERTIFAAEATLPVRLRASAANLPASSFSEVQNSLSSNDGFRVTKPLPLRTRARSSSRPRTVVPFQPRPSPLSQTSSRPTQAPAFAPGLAIKKPKLDPYASIGVSAPKDDYTLLKEKQDTRVGGTWTTIDIGEKKRHFDTLWHETRKNSASDASGPSLPSSSVYLFGDLASGSAVDERFEDPTLDVDPDVRIKFRPVAQILDEQTAPRSAFEVRNEKILPRSGGASVTRVVIGGKVVKELEREADTRGQFQDRFGNYMGENLGPMKKHLIEQREALIRRRDEEMVRLTLEKRALQAMTPEQRAEELIRKEAPIDAFAVGPGAYDADVFEYAEMPDAYNPQSAGASYWSASSTARWAMDVAEHDDTAPRSYTDDHSSARGTAGSDYEGRHSLGQYLRKSDSDRSTIKAREHNIRTGLSSLTESETTSQLGSTRSSTVAPDPGPLLAPIADIVDSTRVKYDAKKARHYDKARLLCSTRGRVVTVTLHAPVVFSPDTLVSRIFGGVIQEIQFHPRERLAQVVFLFPAEAAAFVRHAQTVRHTDRQAYRRLQLDVDWYQGDETKAIMPVQPVTYLKVIDQEARRVLKIEGVPLETRKEDFALDMKRCLRKILVNVALVKDPRRHVREKVGCAAIVGFASIRDAFEAMTMFRDGRVPGYGDKKVSWLRDPCDKSAAKLQDCECLHCKGPRLR